MGTPSISHPSRQSGVALLLAMSLMAGTILLGLAVVETTSTWSHTAERGAERGSARSLAEGGVEYLHHLLRTSPQNGTRTVRYDGWQIDLTTQFSGNTATLESEVSRDGVASGYRCEVELIRRTLPQGVSIKTGDAVTLNENSKLRWSGTLQFRQPPSAHASAAHRGDWERVTTFTPWSFDYSLLRSVPDLVTRRSGSILPAGKYSGFLYSPGSIALSGPRLRVEGLVAVEGDLLVDGGGGNVALAYDRGRIVLAIGGSLIFRNIDQLEVSGMMIVGGDVMFEQVAEANLLGSLGMNGNLSLDHSTVSFDYDVELADFRSPIVQGGDAESSILELWRKPFTP